MVLIVIMESHFCVHYLYDLGYSCGLFDGSDDVKLVVSLIDELIE